MVKPLREIGKYGGTWRRGFTGPFDTSNGHRAAQNDKLLYWDYTGTKIVPNIARAWEVSPDGKVTTLSLRRGMKWSDGAPFTADDFVFWYQDMYLNKELIPVPLTVMTINGKPITIEKVDATTIRLVAPEPYYALPIVLASVWGIGHHARFGRDGLGGFAPAHYLKQFHPKYASSEEMAKKLAELKFETWVTMFKNRNDACRNPDLPVVTPWKTTSPITTPTWVLERNPYSVWVDTDGNQLPYIDRIRMTLGEHLEVINLRAIAGEYDSQARHIDIGKLPGAAREPAEGRLPGAPRSRRTRGRMSPSSATRPSTRTRRSRSGSARASFASRCRTASTASRSTRRSSSAWARRVRPLPAIGPRTSPGPSTRPCTPPTTSSGPTRCSTSSG